MIYRVRVQPPAQRDLDDAYVWAAKRAPETAGRWLIRFEEALQSLSRNPQRCALAPEHKKAKRQIRQLHFGRKPNVFRALFLIEDDTVTILRIRRAARRPLTKRDPDP